jgi:anaerobic ribonucleoside-triphosphate reductase
LYLGISYDQDFDDLMMHLRSKYPKELFDIDGIGKQTDMNEFSKNFFSVNTTTADVSVDANANVDDMSVIAYTHEFPKPFFRLNSYYVMWKYMKQLYGKEVANKAVEQQLIGDIYINDFHGIGAGLPYCFNYSTYDIAINGLSMVKKIQSIPPKYLLAFKSQLEQFVTIAANSTLGATGLADMLIVMSYYVEKVLKTKSDAHFHFKTEEDCWEYVKQQLVSFIYTVNQPMRGNQCVTEDTEVLTPNGFKKYNELQAGDDIYTWNNGKLNIQKVQRVNVYDYDGIMHSYSGKDTIQVVTPNHRVLYKKNNSNEYDLKSSEELFNLKTPLVYPVAMLEDDRPDYDISDDLLKSYILDTNKKELPKWFSKLSKRQANLVIDLWASSNDQQKCQCDNYTIADQLQHICFLAGRGSKITTDEQGNIYLIPYNEVNQSAFHKEEIHYQGKVWCPTTEDGVVVFRKEGKIFISGNSPFTNISIFDDIFLEKLCPSYVFEDGSTPNVKIVKKLQEMYLDIMNEELRRTPITFPVVTACFCIDDDNNILDKDFVHFIAKQNQEFGFINIYCGNSSTLSSCCRLRSDTNNEYFNSFGSGSSKIGSLGVVTINLPRLAIMSQGDKETFLELVTQYVNMCARINNTKRHIVQKRIKNNNHPLYSLGIMDINKQYSTVGVIGLNEAVAFMGYNILDDDGQQLVLDIINTINKINNINSKKYHAPHNVEQIPGENVAIKLPLKDKLLKVQNQYVLYSNQFIPLTANADMLDRIKLQGLFDKHFSGGAICHINVEQPIDDVEQIEELIYSCAKMGVVYWAINYNLQYCCNGHMTVGKRDKCSICGGNIVDNYTRVVGFLTNTKNWHKTRREQDYPNRVWYKG